MKVKESVKKHQEICWSFLESQAIVLKFSTESVVCRSTISTQVGIGLFMLASTGVICFNLCWTLRKKVSSRPNAELAFVITRGEARGRDH